MAPYAIAHLKVGLKLHETGYRFESEERARIYLTNALEPAHDFSGTLAFAIPALAHEAEAVNGVKRHQRFTVVIGNPPYSENSKNDGAWINGLMERYKTTIRSEEAQIKTVSNDYVKFLCLCQWLADQSPAAIIGVITSNGYLDGRLFRDLRRAWLHSFARTHVLNLHGSGRRGDAAANDENVFDILQGVATAVARRFVAMSEGELWYGDFLGPRIDKYSRLLDEPSSDACNIRLCPHEPLLLFTPSHSTRPEIDTWSVSAIFGTGNPSRDRNKTYAGGFKTRQDNFTVALDDKTLRRRIEDLADDSTSEVTLRDRYGLCSTAHFEFDKARRAAQSGELRRAIRRVRYRPFDDRPMIWAREVLCEPQAAVTQHLLQPNLCLVTSRVVKDAAFRHVSVARGPVEVISLSTSTSTNAYMFPLYRYERGGLLLGEDGAQRRTPNLARQFLSELASATGLQFLEASPQRETPAAFYAEEVLGYIYAILHSSAYRELFADELLRDFPEVPLPGSAAVFLALGRLGGELVALHLIEAPAQQALSASYDTAAEAWRYEVAKGQRLPASLSFDGPEKPVVGKVGWSEDTVWIDAVKQKKGAVDARVTGTVGFRGVPEEVWNFHIGGYQVCEKWLKDRGPKKGKPGRTLTAEDVAHYCRIVIALHETIRLMREIDEVIEAHGGWPVAFEDAGGKRAGAIEKESNQDEVDALIERESKRPSRSRTN